MRSEVFTLASASVAAGAGYSVSQGNPLTWADLAGPGLFLVSVLLTLLGAIWTMHQNEIKTLRAQLERIDGKTDSIQTAIHKLSLQLASDYATRAELAALREELRAEIQRK